MLVDLQFANNDRQTDRRNLENNSIVTFVLPLMQGANHGAMQIALTQSMYYY